MSHEAWEFAWRTLTGQAWPPVRYYRTLYGDIRDAMESVMVLSCRTRSSRSAARAFAAVMWRRGWYFTWSPR